MSMPSPEQQQRARIAGVWFVLTFITAIAGLLLYDPVLNDADYGGADVGDGEEDLAERAQSDTRVSPVAEDVVGVIEDRVVEEPPCDRGDEGQGEQHAEDAGALLLLGRGR